MKTTPRPTAVVGQTPRVEHLQKVLLEHGGNLSAAARALKMQRRTLQRKLAKYPVKE